MTNFIDGLNFSLNSQINFKDRELAEKIIRMLLNGPKFLRPKRFGYLQPINRRVDPKNIEPIIELWMGKKEGGNQVSEDKYEEGLLILEFCREGDFMINWTKGEQPPFRLPRFHSISGGIPRKYITKPVSRLAEYLKFVKRLVEIVNPVYGIIQNMMTPQWDVPYDLGIRLPDISWGSIFGPPYIELFGREKIFEAPFYSVEELRSGHIFAQLTESILDPNLPDNIRSEIRTFLGENCFMTGKKSSRHYKDGKTPKF